MVNSDVAGVGLVVVTIVQSFRLLVSFSHLLKNSVKFKTTKEKSDFIIT